MIVTRPSGRRLSVGAVVVGVDVLLELPKGSLVDAGGGLDGGPRYGAVEEPLDGSNTSLQFSFVQTLSVPYQFSFPATFLETVLKTFFPSLVEYQRDDQRQPSLAPWRFRQRSQTWRQQFSVRSGIHGSSEDRCSRST